jgi:hypothetical protein
MSYDALVWLLVGLGIGVAASLMLLIGYSMLEHGRLSRRFRKARLTAAAAAAPVAASVPAAPRTSLLARPAPKPPVEAEPAAEVVVEVKPTVEPKPAVEPKPKADEKPARPALAVVRAPEPKPPATAKPAPAVPVVEAKPAVLSASEALAAPLPKRPQSVEAMFAEAFAQDRLTVSPEPDEAAAAKLGAEKPPA